MMLGKETAESIVPPMFTHPLTMLGRGMQSIAIHDRHHKTHGVHQSLKEDMATHHRRSTPIPLTLVTLGM